MRILKTISLISLIAIAACQSYPTCRGKRNEAPVLDLPPKLLQSVEHGEKYLM
jgi:hypothetical protein